MPQKADLWIILPNALLMITTLQTYAKIFLPKKKKKNYKNICKMPIWTHALISLLPFIPTETAKLN